VRVYARRNTEVEPVEHFHHLEQVILLRPGSHGERTRLSRVSSLHRVGFLHVECGSPMRLFAW